MAIRAVLAAVLAWGVGVAAAGTLAILALSLVADRPSDRVATAPSRSPADEVEPKPPSDEPEPSSDESASPSISTHPSPAEPTITERRFSSAGGTVLAQCSELGAYLASVTPAPGYRAKGVKREPAPEAKVVFESEQSKVEVRVQCASGVPEATIKVEERDDD